MLQDDAALVAQVLGGEKSAFAPLIDRHRPGAIRLARRLLSDPADAEDVVQEALLQAFLGLCDLRRPDRFSAWLFGIVVNLCRMRLRSRHAVYAFEDWHGGHAVPSFRWAERQPSPEAAYETRELHRIVLAAIDTLPTEQQQAVRLHYIDGLTLWEIGLLAGVPVGTVKARLHRARTRLRRDVAHILAQGQHPTTDVEKEVSMIEVTVDDVIVHALKGEDITWPGGSHQLGLVHIILLKEVAGNRILPIWMGVVDANLLAVQLANISPVRPLAYDLMARLLQVAEMPVERVAVTQLRDNIFYATIWVKVGDRVHEVDARPSDALNLALRVRSPIFVAPELFEQARVSFLTQEGAPPERGYVIRMANGRQMRGPELCPLLDEWHRQDLEAQGLPPETPERAYRSFRSLPWSLRGVPEMGHGLLPRQQNPAQPGMASVTPPGATPGADER